MVVTYAIIEHKCYLGRGNSYPYAGKNNKNNKNIMPIFNPTKKLQRLPANTTGKDYVVGDIHGCLEDLLCALRAINFDEHVDRLFSVGDLIDRGPNSKECAELIFKPWFYAVRGNHEQMMIDSLLHNNQNSIGVWLGNGGTWALNEDKTEMHDLAGALDTLPLVIVVGEGAERFNIVHAELIHRTPAPFDTGMRIAVTDEMIDNWVFSEGEEYGMVWGRTIISNGHPSFPPPAHQLWHDLSGMSLTFVGHTPVRDTVMCQRQMYIDNGAVFHHYSTNKSEQNKLVIVCPTTETIHQWSMFHQQLIDLSFADIQQLS